MTNRGTIFGILGIGTLLVLLSPLRPTAESSGRSSTATSRTRGQSVAVAQSGEGVGASLIEAWSGMSLSSMRSGRAVLDVIVATLPDPMDSYQDWTFDSGLEGIRRAFETSGFVLDRYWFPFSRETSAVEAGTAGTLRRGFPGALLFRRGAAELRLVYVVLELPTSGLYANALTRALDERQLLLSHPRLRATPGAGDTIRVVGPTFSGSSRSLYDGLRRWMDAADGRRGIVRVITGSATSPNNRPVFAGDSDFTFAATVNSDARLSAAIQQLVIDSLDIDERSVALLTESSTSYGQDLAGGTDEFLRIAFPMNISTLRGVYEQVVHEEDVTELSLTESSPVELSLEEAERVVTPRIRSRLTAPAVDILLEQIVRTLRDHDIRLVGILATDVRDKLFLAAEIKRRLHDVQLFTYESNVLFLRAHRNHALRGMFVVSTYPLFMENQRWLQRRNDHRQLPFANEGAEGVFNATLVQLDNEAAMVDYAAPSVSSNAPPVWLTVVGERSMAPVAYVPADPEDDYLYRTRQLRQPDPGFVHRSDVSFAGWSLVVALGVILMGFALRTIANVPKRFAEFRDYVRARRPVDRNARLDGLALQRLVHAASLFLHREIYHGFALTALVGIFLPTGALLFTDRVMTESTTAGVLERGFIAVVTLLMALAIVRVIGYAIRTIAYFRDEWWDLLVARPWGSPRERWIWRVETLLRSGVVAIGLGYLGLICVVGFDVIALSWVDPPSNWWIFFYRAIQLDSGISPLLPLLLIGAGMGVWSAWHLRRINLLLEHNPFEEYAYAHLSMGPETGPRRVSRRLMVRARTLSDRYRAELGNPTNIVALILLMIVFWFAFLRTGGTSIGVSTGLAALFGLFVATAFVLWTSRWARPPPLVPGKPDDATRIAEAVRSVRDALFLVVPGPRAWLILLLLGSAGVWLSGQFEQPIDGLWLSGAYTLVFTFGILAMLASIPWAATRMVVVWTHLQRYLTSVGRLPLISAFDRLPPRISQLTRLTLLRPKPSNVIEPVAAMQLDHLRTMYDREGDRFASSRCGDPELAEQIGELVRTLPKTPDPTGAPTVDMLERIHAILSVAWHREPNEGEIREILRMTKQPDIGTDPRAASTVSRFRRSFAGPLRLWLRCAEEYLALWIVHYVEGVLEQLRRLSLFLLMALVIAAGLLTSYPFHPQSRIKLVFIFVVVGTVASIFYVMVRMGRDEVLSRVTKTEPGKIQWNAHFVFNMVIFGVIPLISLLSAEFPAVRALFDFVVDPLLGAFSSL